MNPLEALSEEEKYLWAILSDPSGLDLAEFSWMNPEDRETRCFRAWPYQWAWWRDESLHQIDCSARSIGKSLSIKVRAYAFPFVHPGEEMLLTAPEGNHLDAITDIVETGFGSNYLGREMLIGGRIGVKHRPFHVNFKNGSRIMGRIPQRDGKGVKGCTGYDTPILTKNGFVMSQNIVPGDEVMSHTGQWKKVTHVYFDNNFCYEVKGYGSFPITVSHEHRFYGAQNHATLKQPRKFDDELSFDSTEHLIEDNFYWATPNHIPYVEPKYPDHSEFGKSFNTNNEDFWWIVGRYLADGYTSFNSKASYRVHWVVVPEKKDVISNRIKDLGLNCSFRERKHSSAGILELCSTGFAKWLKTYFGYFNDTKKMPAFVYSLSDNLRDALLEGYFSGDGSIKRKNERTAGSASKVLAIGMQLLAQTLGYSVSCNVIQPKQTHIQEVALKSTPKLSWRITISKSSHSYRFNKQFSVGKIKSVVPLGATPIVDIRVEDDHSYLSGSIMSHNVHPLWLELDEAQDYPEPGWTELFETLKQGHKGSMWRAHGVTKGIQDSFYKFTQPNSGWKVHRITAMHRPTWTDKERQDKISQYGSQESPDYRRNILGEHGDANHVLFNLFRLMQGVDQETTSSYNDHIYTKLQITNEMVLDYDDDILPLLDFPVSHTKYKHIWIGADIGMTSDPTEILVFSEEDDKKTSKSVLRLISRIKLLRINHENQANTMLFLLNFYKPHALSLDKTGLGLPLFQDIQTRASRDPNIKGMLDRIKGYNFSEKILVDIDSSIEVDPDVGDVVKEAGIRRNVLEASTDILRDLVDSNRIRLPWDKEIINEFQGQTFSYSKNTRDIYGRARRFSDGSFHALDAARMAVLGWQQDKITTFIKQADKYEPPPMMILI